MQRLSLITAAGMAASLLWAVPPVAAQQQGEADRGARVKEAAAKPTPRLAEHTVNNDRF